MKRAEKFLKEAGITPTPVRVLLYNCLKQAVAPLSLGDMERELESVDKSTISRTLSTFRDKHLIHSLNDGSGCVKYEICHSHNLPHHDDLHVHFRCGKCGETFCLNSIKIPEVNLPEGYSVREVTYIISGFCPSCNNLE